MRSLIILAVVFPQITWAQANFPSKLSGRWTTVDGRGSQSISITTSEASGIGELTVFSNASQCSIRSAPMVMTRQGDALVVKVDPGYVNPCRKDVLVTLKKVEGTENYEGELLQTEASGQFPVLKVKVSP